MIRKPSPQEQFGNDPQSNTTERIGCVSQRKSPQPMATIRKASPPGHFGYDRQSQTTGANWLCFAKAVAAAIGYDLQSLPRQQIGYVSQSAGRSRLAVIGKARCRNNWL
jgi:hypothetical protein